MHDTVFNQDNLDISAISVNARKDLGFKDPLDLVVEGAVPEGAGVPVNGGAAQQKVGTNRRIDMAVDPGPGGGGGPFNRQGVVPQKNTDDILVLEQGSNQRGGAAAGSGPPAGPPAMDRAVQTVHSTVGVGRFASLNG
jgi:hypothetical protein